MSFHARDMTTILGNELPTNRKWATIKGLLEM